MKTIRQETTRVAAIVLAGWAVLVAAIFIFGWEKNTVPTLQSRPTVEARLAARLSTDPTLGPWLSSRWLANGEPAGGTTSSIGRPKPTPEPSPTPVDDFASRIAATAPAHGVHTGIFLPILYYHHVPEDFDRQLSYLAERGYHVIDLDTAVAGLAGAALPSRPVAITFDDGFSDQLSAVPILERHHMTATFYIINGGPASQWCIGAGRRYQDPLQPPGGCGDSYLNWDQVRAMDKSGAAVIGGHTLDHPNLAELTPEQQRQEITASKAGIEAELGHPIHHFAYPYGGFNSTTVELVRQAGYASAVSTHAGTEQTYAGRFELRRIRTAFNLPE